MSVRQDPDVQSALDSFWIACADDEAVDETAYRDLHVRVQKATVDDFSETEAEKIAADEFEADLEGGRHGFSRKLTRDAFLSSVCEITEQFVDVTAGAARYARFLRALHECVCAPSGELRPLADVAPMNRLVLFNSNDCSSNPLGEASQSGRPPPVLTPGAAAVGEDGSVRDHPDVQRALDAFWVTSSAGGAVGEAAYTAVHVRVQKAMQEEFDEAAATELAAEEFEGEMARA